jgi:DNA-binding Lrp family transcriptional regulator
VTPSASEIDDLDRRLVNRLRVDGRTSNRQLAAELGVSEATIASRLRRLEDNSAMRVLALTDISAFGFPLFAFVLLTVEGRAALDTGHEIAGFSEVISVSAVIGRFDLLVTVLARDRPGLAGILDRLRDVPGVERFDVELALELHRYESHWASLTIDHGPTSAPALDHAVDTVDLALISALQANARCSNQTIAKAIGVSEGTVRTRIKRLQDERRVRIQAVSDVDAFGLGAQAVVGLRIRSGSPDPVYDLTRLPGVAVLFRSLGQFDYVAALLAPTRAELIARVLGDLQTHPAIRSVEAIEVAGNLKHVHTWVHILPLDVGLESMSDA